ncbi:MAG: T9SS type A sorting domain-containing protein [bacterium]|nr:MAG: T9SS type A sorting domain-containing protein [bacterium]
MTWSQYNDDTSYQSPLYWLHSWVGTRLYPLGVDDPNAPIIFSYRLEQNYPNPFNPSTQIQYSLKTRSEVQLVVYNALGQKVATLVNNVQPAGVYTVQFDALRLASGIYFYYLKTAEFESVKKMILMK